MLKPEKMMEVLKHEGVVSIVTKGENNPHVVNSWNSYITITGEGNLLIPAGGMKKTEENIKENSKILLTLASKEVEGFNSMGSGFLIEGIGEFLYEDDDYETMKLKFPWARAVLRVKILKITQTL